jgi:hypothetical protein
VRGTGGAAELGVRLVAELDKNREDLVGLLAAELDVLAVALLGLQLDDLRAVALLHLGVAGYHLVQRLLALGVLGLAQRAVEVVIDRVPDRLRVVAVHDR